MLGFLRASGVDRAAWTRWLAALIGAWVCASAFVLDTSATAATNDAVAVAAVVVMALTCAALSPRARRS